MRTFSEERKLGTLELLLSRPLSLKAIILGKFTGVFVLGILSLLPSLIYTYTIYNLSPQSSSPDLGLIIGGFIGLLLLLALFTAIGLFTSSLTDNQIAAFLSAAVLLFILYFGFENLAGLLERAGLILSITAFGIKFHYENIGQGLIDSRDIAYFFSLTLVFLFWTGVRLNKLRA
jgi:ABC-2 type transport system permease protein